MSEVRILATALVLTAGCSSNPAGSDALVSDSDALVSDSDALVCDGGPERPGPYTRIMIDGDTSLLGVIDPSVEYVRGAPFGLMTYTAVPAIEAVHIAIAVSEDAGASWRYLGDVTTPTDIDVTSSDTTVCGGPTTCRGTFVHESSSLVLDPYDPDPSRRLKVFAHGYVFTTDRWLQLGYVAMVTASVPEGPWTETKLFGWPSSSPISSEGVVYDVTTDLRLPEMHDCFIVGEPGALVRDGGVLDLALSCVMATGAIDVRLLRSNDHGASWSYVGRLLSASDAPLLGSENDQINGADLFELDGAFHLIATPAGTVQTPDGPQEGLYRGCVVVPVADIELGLVERCGGAPVIAASYPGQPLEFVGACSAAEGATVNGVLIPVPDFDGLPDLFRIYGSAAPLP